MGNLPLDLKRGQLADTAEKGKSTELELSNPDLKRLLDGIPCIGEIAREGKDAAGKPLENEFYYVPEMDADSMRRDAVMGGRGGTGLRTVRKSHKVGIFAKLEAWTDVHFSNTTGRNRDIDRYEEESGGGQQRRFFLVAGYCCLAIVHDNRGTAEDHNDDFHRCKRTSTFTSVVVDRTKLESHRPTLHLSARFFHLRTSITTQLLLLSNRTAWPFLRVTAIPSPLFLVTFHSSNEIQPSPHSHWI